MLKYFQLSVAIFTVFFLTQTIHAAPLRTLSLDFTRELTENNKTEQISGTLHYDVQTARVVVEIDKPIKQIMLVKDKILEIYYPVEKQAFRFISKGRIPLPFVESILQTTQAEYGLTAIGYSLDKHDIVDKVLYTYWNPPKKAKESLGGIVLGMHNDKLISAEVKNPKGIIVARSIYKNHSKIGVNYIPMTVTSSTYGEKSDVIQHERIVYSNPKVNVESLNSILQFSIPNFVEVKEIRW